MLKSLLVVMVVSSLAGCDGFLDSDDSGMLQPPPAEFTSLGQVELLLRAGVHEIPNLPAGSYVIDLVGNDFGIWAGSVAIGVSPLSDDGLSDDIDPTQTCPTNLGDCQYVDVYQSPYSLSGEAFELDPIVEDCRSMLCMFENHTSENAWVADGQGFSIGFHGIDINRFRFTIETQSDVSIHYDQFGFL